MKKISYYVAAFALCCGVSQTLTSCIEETEEPDDVKALRQAEIARVNAQAESLKADAAKTNAEALESEANAALTNAEAAVKAVEKAVAEGASAEEIAKKIAEYKKAALADQKEVAVALLPSTLNDDCDHYESFLDAQAIYLGGEGPNVGTITKGTQKKFEEAEANLTLEFDAIEEQANALAEFEIAIRAAQANVDDMTKAMNDYNKTYGDGGSVGKAILDASDPMSSYISSSETYTKSSEDKDKLKADADAYWKLQIAEQQNYKDKLQNKYDNAKANKINLGNDWYNGTDGVYDLYLEAKAKNDIAKAEYEANKAAYEAELAALQSVK